MLSDSSPPWSASRSAVCSTRSRVSGSRGRAGLVSWVVIGLLVVWHVPWGRAAIPPTLHRTVPDVTCKEIERTRDLRDVDRLTATAGQGPFGPPCERLADGRTRNPSHTSVPGTQARSRHAQPKGAVAHTLGIVGLNGQASRVPDRRLRGSSPWTSSPSDRAWRSASAPVRFCGDRHGLRLRCEWRDPGDHRQRPDRDSPT